MPGSFRPSAGLGRVASCTAQIQRHLALQKYISPAVSVSVYPVRNQIPLRGLDRRVPQPEFDLLQIPAILPTQFRAGTAKVMGAEVLDPDFFRLTVPLPTRSPSRSACRD